MRGQILAVLTLATPAPARAEPSETDRNLAHSLFEQARVLMRDNKYAEACPKLQESQRLDPGGGTLLNLALCHELQGKLATAWAEFKMALSVAQRDGRADRVQAAQERIAALEPKVPWVTVAVTGTTDGEQLALDRTQVSKTAWGVPVSIDPGRHELVATAPGRKRWIDTFLIGVGDKKTVSVPELGAEAPQPAPGVPTPSPATPAAASTVLVPPAAVPSTSAKNRKVIGWTVGGAGVAALAVGSFFGIQSFSKRHQSDGECPTDTTCTAQGVTWNDQAKTAAWISNIGMGLGIVGVGVGTYLLFGGGRAKEGEHARRSSERTLSLGTNLMPDGGQLGLGGTW